MYFVLFYDEKKKKKNKNKNDRQKKRIEKKETRKKKKERKTRYKTQYHISHSPLPPPLYQPIQFKNNNPPPSFSLLPLSRPFFLSSHSSSSCLFSPYSLPLPSLSPPKIKPPSFALTHSVGHSLKKNLLKSCSSSKRASLVHDILFPRIFDGPVRLFEDLKSSAKAFSFWCKIGVFGGGGWRRCACIWLSKL